MRSRSMVVSIIGRPNVGKSTIFNRLMKKSFKAMAYDLPGVTRDRHYGIVSLEHPKFEQKQDIILVDTGGFYPEKVEETPTLGKQKGPHAFFNIMADQAKMAIDESDLILFVVDVREGLLPFDKTICEYIRSQQKDVWLLVNKYDSDKQMGTEAEFYELGLDPEQMILVSAEHGRGLIDLAEKLYMTGHERTLDEKQVQKGVKPNHDVVGNIAIIGAPNAGKSTLLNRLVGAQRALVSDVAGTTVDPIEAYIDLDFGDKVDVLASVDNPFRKRDEELYEEYRELESELDDAQMLAYNEMPAQYKNSDEDFDDESEFDFTDEEVNVPEESLYTVEEQMEQLDDEVSEDEPEFVNTYRSVKIVDTAGIRKKNMVTGFVEEQSVYRSLKAISESDVVIYLVDVTIGITHQDRRLCDIALERGKSIIICLNKVDLIPQIMNDQARKREWLLDLRAQVPWLGFCEILTISAKKGSFIKSLRRSLAKTLVVRSKKITTGKLNQVVAGLIDRHPVVLQKSKGVRFKVKYASMIKASPPTFLLFSNKSKGIPENYRKYLTNGIRREFHLQNTPVHLIFRTTTDIEKRMRKLGKA